MLNVLWILLLFILPCSAENPAPGITAHSLQKEAKMISIQIGDKVFDAELNESKSAASFFEQLPLRITMQDLSHNEKYYQFRNGIAAEPSKPYPKIHCGDLMIYSDRYIVLFYKTFMQDTYRYVKIGNVVDTTGLADAVGNGSVSITWSAK